MMIDLTDRMPEVVDQGTRPTCLACAVSDAHQIFRRGVDALSIESLFHSCASRDPAVVKGGTTIACMTAALGQDGQPIEAAWPYEKVQPMLGRWTPPPHGSEMFCALLRIVDPAFDGIVTELRRGRPVVLGLSVRDSLLRCGPDGLLIEDEGPVRGMHAVLAVGSVDVPTETIRVRNSWGIGWGADGHASIGRAYFNSNVRAAAVVVEHEE